mmetsp:Transcript_49645/g.111614  ORF Transcript_49645/g.111614 Transcript_49645/m.111614 type:complete len:200 (+) Transcript_49645:42-641(+)
MPRGQAVVLPAIMSAREPRAVKAAAAAAKALARAQAPAQAPIKATLGDSTVATPRPGKEELRRRLSQERKLRGAVETEAARLRVELEGAGQAPPPRLTGDFLRRHEDKPVQPARQECRGSGGADLGSAAEVLQWKRLVQRCERRQTKEEDEELAGVKITQRAYSGKDAIHQYQSLSRARQATLREAQGSLCIGTRACLT